MQGITCDMYNHYVLSMLWNIAKDSEFLQSSINLNTYACILVWFNFSSKKYSLYFVIQCVPFS